MISDGLDLILFFPVNDVWGWSREVGSVLFRFSVWGEEASVEDIMYCP